MIAGSMSAAAQWKFNADVDAFTDEAKYQAYSSTIVGNSVSLLGGRCHNGVIDAMWSPSKYIGGGYGATVMYRIDKNKPVTETWALGTSNRLVFVPYPEQFLRALRDGSEVAIRVTDHNGSNIDATVDLTGSKEVIDRLFKACNS